VAKLGARAATLAAEESERRMRHAERTQRWSQAAAALDRDQDAAVSRLLAVLEPAAAARKRDLDLAVTGHDTRTAVADPSLARYRADRALVRLAAPLAQALSELAPSGDLPARDLVPASRALVRGFAAGEEDPPISTLARAAVATLIEHLGALAVLPPAPSRATGRVRELSAIANALEALY
jgi:hypothetical protein